MSSSDDIPVSGFSPVSTSSAAPSITSTSSSRSVSGSSAYSQWSSTNTATTSMSVMGGVEYQQPLLEAAVDAEMDLDDQYPSDYFSASDNDSTAGDSSAYEFYYENGRRYSTHRHRLGADILPNDKSEAERQEGHHHVYRMLMGGHLHLLQDSPMKVLDIGTGCGSWALDYAEENPEAEVYATDISPVVQPWTPANCHFIVEDAETDWSFDDNYFGLIHSRNISQSIRDWPTYLRKIYNHLEPGGYVQLLELNIEALSDDNCYGIYIKDLFDRMGQALRAIGMSNINPLMEGLMKEAGFVDVTQRVYKLPWSSWPRDPRLRALGRYTQRETRAGLETYGMALLTRVLGMELETAQNLIDSAFEDVASRRSHIYNRHHVFIARKPFDYELADLPPRSPPPTPPVNASFSTPMTP